MRSLGKAGKLFLLIYASILVLTSGMISVASLQSASAQTGVDWKDRWEKVLVGAKKERNVVVYGPPGEIIRRAITDGFKKAFPEIDIEYSGGRGVEQSAKIKAERDAGIYSIDIILNESGAMIAYLKPTGALDAIMPTLLLPEVTDLKHWRDGSFEFIDRDNRYILGFVKQVKVPLIFDPKQVKAEEVDELYKLLDPKWKGKIVVNDPVPQGVGAATFRWIWHALGPEKAKDYYRRIRTQAGAVDRDQRRQIEWVAQGKYPVLFSPSDGVLVELRQRGLKFAVLPEFKDYGTYTTASFGSAMILKNAPHPNAATAFLNWALSKEGQTAWSRAMGHVSRRLDVPTDHLPAYIVPRPGVNYWVSTQEENLLWQPEAERIVQEIFGR